MIRLLSLGGFVALWGCSDSSPAQNLPENAVVSTTLCADTYLLAIPELEPRLAALSWQSRTSLSSAQPHLQKLPQADETAERLFQWRDATIVSSANSTGDINLVWGEDFETVWANLATLAEALNVPDPSETLQAALLGISKPTPPPRLLYLDRSGATAGAGTFVDAVFSAIGAQNVITTPGWQSPDTETLLNLQPDAIVTSFMGSNYVSVNDRSVRQAALSKKIHDLPKIDVHGGLWPCAGPGLVQAAHEISRGVSQL